MIAGATLSAGGRTRQVEFALRAEVSCRSGRTTAASKEMRAFRLQGLGDFACVRPKGRPVQLTGLALEARTDASGAGDLRIAGRYVAFTYTTDSDCTLQDLVLVDVRARRTVWEIGSSDGEFSETSACYSPAGFEQIVLRPSGRVAWTEGADSDGRRSVNALDPVAKAQRRVLDEGADVDASSLRAVDAATIGWTRGGVPKTAPLG